MRTNKYYIALALVLNSSLLVAQDEFAEDIVNLEVTQKGVYEFSYNDLLSFGADLAGEPLNRVALTNAGSAVQLEVSGSDADSAVFGPGSSIRFIGHGLDTLYTDTNVYTLRLDSEAQVLIEEEAIEMPSRVAYATSYLATQEYSPQEAYSFVSPDANDPWYARRVLALRKSASTFINLDLPGYVPGGNSGSTKAKMKMRVWGGTDLPGNSDDHHIKVDFNGQNVVDETFDGFAKKEVASELSNLRVGSNSVRLHLPLDMGHNYEAVNLDSVSVSYPREFSAQDGELFFTSAQSKFRVQGFNEEQISVYRRDLGGQITKLSAAQIGGRCTIAQPRCSVRFGGAGQVSDYFVVSQSATLKPQMKFVPLAEDISSQDAEYLIITHPDFLADEGEQDLLGDLVEDLSDSYGSVAIVDVEQIYAQFGGHVFDPQAIRRYIKYANENLGTQTVLLVGGDVYDYRGFENQDARSFIPSIYVPTSDVVNFAPVDAKYVDLDDDNVPDLAIGRMPVRSMQELASLLAKRTAYINRDYPRTALFAADSFDPLEEYSFQLDALSVQQEFFSDWNVETAFVDEDGVSGARAKIVAGINAGTSLTSFFGHSSTSQWTFDGLFNGFDAANLSNANRPTIVTQFGCWNTYYVNPNEDSMGHRFMMEGNRGAVAVMGATTLTSASNEKILARLVFERLNKGDTLGQAIKNAKQKFAESRPSALDVILGWTLLGPPELKL